MELKKNIVTSFNRAKEWFWALPLWKRTIISSIIGSIGGSSAISFSNKYALYYYAFKNGFRVPVEGVEYLDLAVAIVSFLVILITTLGTILFYNILKIIAVVISKIFTKNPEQILKTENRIMLFFIISIILLIALKLYYEGYESVINNIKSDTKPTLLILGFFSGIYAITLFKSSKNEKSRKLITLYSILAGVFILIALMFNQTIYSNFLRSIRYGGEIPIEVEYRKADNTEDTIDGLLMLKTTKSISIKNEVNNNISEIPVNRISKIVFINN